MRELAGIEKDRLALQRECDQAKSQAERNRLGQFATPPKLARDIIDLAYRLVPNHSKIRFLDPAFGTGAFYSALLRRFERDRIESALGFEIDQPYAQLALKLWSGSGLELRTADFTEGNPPNGANTFNLIVCNPPYVRHHHLAAPQKTRLRHITRALTGLDASGLTGLYCYFLLLAHAWAAEDGVCIWLIPSEFMDVNYGAVLRDYLSTNVTLLRIHRFQAHDVQFADALVSSAVVCFQRRRPAEGHSVTFSFGGTLNHPKIIRQFPLAELRSAAKWNLGSVDSEFHQPKLRLCDFFEIKRGLATGDNKFFILSRKQVTAHALPMQFLTPILPSPRHLKENEVQADDHGNPVIERQLFLLDCSLPEREVQAEYPNLWCYLEKGRQNVATGYLCRSRSPWYSQERRPAPPFLCTYMARGKRGKRGAFRFILNHSRATAANVYLLLYPKPELEVLLRSSPELSRRIWLWLASLSPQSLLNEGRVYGGGLHKVEPRELGNVPADSLGRLVNIPHRPKPVQLCFSPGSPQQHDDRPNP